MTFEEVARCRKFFFRIGATGSDPCLKCSRRKQMRSGVMCGPLTHVKCNSAIDSWRHEKAWGHVVLGSFNRVQQIESNTPSSLIRLLASQLEMRTVLVVRNFG